MNALMCLTLAGLSIPTWAGHAETGWPEPVMPYRTGQVMFDRLEVARTDSDKERVVWDMLAWYGGDRKRLYFKSEGENQLDDGEPSELEGAELLGSYLVAPFWELQAGVGVAGSTASGADREKYLVFSFFGTAPYRLEMDNSLRVNEDGDIAISLEAEYDIRLTQVSYLQPRLEVAAALTDAEAYERPSGLNNIRLGLRYRYELSREFAPYIGAYWDRSLGDSADKVRTGGGDVSQAGVVLGARMWF